MTREERVNELLVYGVKVLAGTNDSSLEEDDKGRRMMSQFADEVVSGCIELLRDYTENGIDLESESRSDYEDDSYLGTDEDEEEDDDDMDSRLENEDEEDEEDVVEDDKYKDNLFNPEELLRRYAESIVDRGF